MQLFSMFRFSNGDSGCSLWEPLGLQAALPAGSSTTFPRKSLPDHKNWHFLIFLNDDINHLLFLFTLSETCGNSFLFLFPSSGCFPGTFNPLFSLARWILSALLNAFPWLWMRVSRR